MPLKNIIAVPPAFSSHPRATAVIALGADGHILDCNPIAMQLLVGDHCVGRHVIDLVSDAEKFGIVTVGTSGLFDQLLTRKLPDLQFEMTDGRTIMVSAFFAETGETLLELSDVSSVVRNALSLHRDPLTGLPNRLELINRLSVVIGEPVSDKSVALIYLDLDRFKSVNDTLGHPIGDALLKLVADRIKSVLGDGDTVARLGGDEFAILLSRGEQPQSVERMARKLVDLVGRSYLVKGHLINIGVSIGIAIMSPDVAIPDDLIKNADLALFKAKKDGRGTYRFYTNELDVKSQERRHLETDMRRALALQEFSLAYQPQYEIVGRRLTGFEALLRWPHEKRGNVSPADFIPLAEEIGLIVPLGEWVLRTACREAATWPGTLSIAVNLSPVQFRSANLVQTIASALKLSGLAPDRLELEITEGVLMDDTTNVIAMLTQIRALGVRISMDDFGTGYSSLSYLQKFPFDKIKIDQSFVRNAASDPDSAAIVRAVAALGDSLGIVTIAEGVETEEQLSQIAQQGCRQVQGFLTGRPLSAQVANTLATSAASTTGDIDV